MVVAAAVVIAAAGAPGCMGAACLCRVQPGVAYRVQYRQPASRQRAKGQAVQTRA